MDEPLLVQIMGEYGERWQISRRPGEPGMNRLNYRRDTITARRESMAPATEP
jgi:hypothetical protein